MGFSHSWRYRPDSDTYAHAWPHILDDATTIIAALRDRIRIAGPAGYGDPVLDPTDGIAYNGAGTHGYDTFYLSAPGHGRGQWWFCKTDQRAYDLAVTAMLLRCHLLLPDTFHLGGDGSWDSDWRPARNLVHRLFGAAAPDTSPLSDTTAGLTWDASVFAGPR